ncbi:tetratricopeptide repeat protein [Paraburkholderia rhizosphaerae]|uniref:Sel1 repeat-containing protein n=1 Tax=Paraburkholderia rhizosphaerae TaxID=480658 RepID=A0A4R8LXJ4_9BURK|nr:SEL1-like repeat protein [Paraburkholderia rhizosphaerae]TDY52950.1 Sel1 repeat-containing protein [Paraburkholderia rhizosphaerae]
MKCLVLSPCLLLCVAACTPALSVSDTVVICDERGCARSATKEQSRDAQIERAPAAEDARIGALSKRAMSEPKAAYDLGLRYLRGDGVRQDSYQALAWMRDAATRGDLHAQKALGSFYLFGFEEMGADPREAEKWLSIAASRGDDEAQTLLQQARAAKELDQNDYRARTAWRDVNYRNWYSGYPYLGTWRQNAWYY